MKLGITPTALKGWFQYRCERKLVYETMDQDLRKRVPIHEQAAPSSWGDEGIAYEAAVLAELSGRSPGSVLRPGPADGNCLTTAASLRFLNQSEPEYHFAHQVLLGSSQALRRLLRLSEDVEIRSGRVDLVEAVPSAGGPRFKVIDIKAAQFATVFHKAQVAFYALMLQATLQENRIPGELAAEGEIWHRTGPGGPLWQVESFPLRNYMRLVRDFFQQRVSEISSYAVSPGGPDNTPFHVYFKCEQCKFLGHCERSIAASRPTSALDLSAVPGVTQQSKRTLHRLDMHTVADLVRHEGKLRGQDDWRLRTAGWKLVHRAKAIHSGEVRRLSDQYSLQMPPVVDRPIYLLADRDPVDGRLVTIGCLVVGSDADHHHHVRVITKPDSEAEALIEILGVVLEALKEVDEWNAAYGEKQPLHTHIFTYESAEAGDLRAAIGRHLSEPALRRGLLDLVRIFPPDQVVPEPDYKGFHHLPASALRNILTDLFAFPVRVSHDLRRVSCALREVGAELASVYDPTPRFARPFSSRLSLEITRQLQDDPTLAAPVAKDVRERLSATHALVQWLLRQNGAAPPGKSLLRLNKRPFRFVQGFDPLHAGDLDILRAQALLESRSGLLQALVALARPGRQRRDRLDCYAELSLIHQEKDRRGNLILRFHVPASSRSAELQSSSFGLILSDGSPDLVLNPDNWPGLQATLLPPGPEAGAHEIRVKVWARVVRVGLIPRLIAEGVRSWYVDKAFVDLNTPRLTSFLTFLAEGP